MCGIIAVLRQRSRRRPPSLDDVERPLRDALAIELGTGEVELPQRLTRCAEHLGVVNDLLYGPPGVACLLVHGDLAGSIRVGLADLELRLDALEATLDSQPGQRTGPELEQINAAIIRLRDASWAIRNDRLNTADRVADLAGSMRGLAAIEAFTSIETALSALDRLEVRGRDSAGLHVFIAGGDLDRVLTDAGERLTDPRFTARSIRAHGGVLSFVYKRAAEIGELGDNVAALRAQIGSDDLLRRALAGDDSYVTVVGHTRWASVGIISEANAHPVNSEQFGDVVPYTVAVLNGDVDNHAELVDRYGLDVHTEITTDAKVIPCLVARHLADGAPLDAAFRQTVAEFEGSVAIAMASAGAPDEVHLALSGSGQALYIGLAEDAFIVASEPYGVVEDMLPSAGPRGGYLRMDGDDRSGSIRGQIISLDRNRAGELDGVTRRSYDGLDLPIDESELTRPEITTRDVDRGDYPHYLLKEISESPRSFHKTLRGRVVEEGSAVRVRLDEDALPRSTIEKLERGTISRILVIGQGTAAVASQGVASMLAMALATTPTEVRALPATELSGFGLRSDMTDTLVIAISQSGTTTDTNRTVDLVRDRGASVIAIVNRRGSDLCDKSDGVLLTSDGRDVEMSVASTKAFYSQIAAGVLLTCGVARAMRCPDAPRFEDEILRAVRALPEAMTATLRQRPRVAEAAEELALSRRYWAIVGNGRNKIAAEEIRIKLSELCYKSISCDATEDKKHIDLSSEPMILVCAAGLTGSTADDVAKEVAIYRAHQAIPIVIASEGERRFDAASAVIEVPAAHPSLAFILSTMAGHLFGYEAALAIDRLAQPLRQACAAIEAATRGEPDGETVLRTLAPQLIGCASEFQSRLIRGSYDGQLEARTAVHLASLWRYATGVAGFDTYQLEHGKVGTPAIVIDDLTAALTAAIEQLTRPIDAIKHQAKTVTVGISRSDEGMLSLPLVQSVLDGGATRDHLSYDDLRALAALSPTVERVVGFSRYAIDAEGDHGTIRQITAGGIAESFPSRTLSDPTLRGTKHQVVREQQVLVARGRSDDRTVVFVPEVRNKRTTGITLLHVRLHEYLDSETMRRALSSYRNRYSTLVDVVTETEPKFEPTMLEGIPVVELLTLPIHVLADRLHSRKS